MNFAIRNGLLESKPQQRNGMDDDLRHSLWNELDDLFKDVEKTSSIYHSQGSAFNNLMEIYWRFYFKQPTYVMDQTIYPQQKKELIRERYYSLPWYGVYNLLEYTIGLLPDFVGDKRAREYIQFFNQTLLHNNSAYRIIEGTVALITSELEIKNVEECLKEKDEAATHLSSALSMLSNKEKDQSRESIAQSISAVEAIAKKATGRNGATLSELCNKKSKILPNHPQLKQALLNLYNYTSGKEGIRHALTDESQPVNKEFAQYMLVICSAFVNLIRSESFVSMPVTTEGEIA